MTDFAYQGTLSRAVQGFSAFGEVAVAQPTPIAGWTHAYNVNADLVSTTVTGSGEVTQSGGKAILNTTAAASSSATMATRKVARYIPGQGGLVRITAHFTAGVAGSTQLVGVGTAANGLFFGFNGATFGVLRRRAGLDYWTPQAKWNTRTLITPDGRNFVLDHTKGNIYQIRYQWLGYGMITFGIEDGRQGDIVTVHRIQYANTSADTTVLNPTFPVYASVANTTNDTAISLGTPSAMAFTEGLVTEPAPVHPLSLTRTLASAKTVTTEANVLTISNQAEWQSATNQVPAVLRSMSVAVDGTKNATVYIKKGVTLGGTPSYSDFSANTSPVQYDTAGTTITGGTLLAAVELAKVDSRIVDLTPYDVVAYPGERITVSAVSTSSTDVDLALTWQELF